jgi:CheY-like chemotaxis protein
VAIDFGDPRRKANTGNAIPSDRFPKDGFRLPVAGSDTLRLSCPECHAHPFAVRPRRGQYRELGVAERLYTTIDVCTGNSPFGRVSNIRSSPLSSPVGARPHLATNRILIADDNVVLRHRLGELLKSHAGWEVCAEVENGQQAVLKTCELKPDLIILDLAMPVMDGLEAAREISIALPSVPILIFTQHKLPAVELEAREAGAREVISKGEATELLSAIEGLLGNATK